MSVKKYHVFKRNPINCCCNPNSYMIFEEFNDGTTKVTTKLKHGNYFITTGITHYKTNSIELKTCTYLRDYS